MRNSILQSYLSVLEGLSEQVAFLDTVSVPLVQVAVNRVVSVIGLVVYTSEIYPFASAVIGLNPVIVQVPAPSAVNCNLQGLFLFTVLGVARNVTIWGELGGRQSDPLVPAGHWQKPLVPTTCGEVHAHNAPEPPFGQIHCVPLLFGL